MRILLALSLFALILTACDADIFSESDEPPTPIVITSTPGDDSETPTVESTATATATSDDAGTAAATVEATATSPPDSPSPTAPDDDPTPQEDGENGEARAEIEEIESQVVELRGLERLEEIEKEIIDREELTRRVEEIINDEYSPEQARVDALTYWLLRLIPDGSIDLYQLQIDLLGEQVAGYYDPETDELVVVTAEGDLSVVDKITMAHEIVHALQDQHFDLIAIDEHATDLDRSAAITALIEGDASLAMTDYMFGYLDPQELFEMLGESLLGGEDYAVLDSAPRYISDGLIFSYEAGQEFATALHEEGGYEAIDRAFDDPPLSTEQILHPEKYLAAERDDPILVENPDVAGDLGEGWEWINGDVLGEWDLQIMLEEGGISSSAAATAAAGWGGSWYDIYESDSASLALLTTRWDTAQDATEFGDALIQSFGEDAQAGSVWDDGDRYYSVVAGGDTVVMISGTDEASVSAVLAVMSQTV